MFKMLLDLLSATMSVSALCLVALYIWFEVLEKDKDAYEEYEEYIITEDGEKIPYNEEDQE